MNSYNLLLSSLPGSEYQRLSPYFEEIPLDLGMEVASMRNKDEYMYFPLSGIVSLLHYLENGECGEIAVVGNEGAVGTWIFMSGISNLQVVPIVQARGRALRVPAKVILREFQKAGQFQYQLLCYTQALMLQISQTALCNRHHQLQQQFARWLLLSRDCLRPDEQIVMTQDLIANMLGVRREGVNSAARKLQEKGLIDYTRGKIVIKSHAGLLECACECYMAVREVYEGLYSTSGGAREAGQ